MSLKRSWSEDTPSDDLQGRSGMKLDYYCEICDSHMNSVQMWQSHIAGKRHAKNAKKEPGEPPSKIKSIKLEDVTPCLEELLEGVHEPVIGLDHISELQKVDSQMDPTYTCYLCHGTFTTSTIVPHILSTKHRLNFMKEMDPESFQLIESLKFKKTSCDSLAAVRAQELESSLGRGRPEVKLEKTKHTLNLPMRKTGKSSHYVDLDAPPRSQDCYTPDLPGSPAPETAVAPAIPPPQGIDDIDILRDIKMIPPKMKLQLLEELIINKTRPIKTDSEARVMLHSLRMMSRCWMQYQLRKMPHELLHRMYNDITYPDETKSYSGILGLNRKFEK